MREEQLLWKVAEDGMYMTKRRPVKLWSHLIGVMRTSFLLSLARI